MARRFEVITKRKTQGEITLPKRGTAFSAGYDFYSPIYAVVQPNEIVKIWTDVKAYMNPQEVLIIDVRSSMGGKFMLANTIGVIDKDYADNSQNEGNIGIFLKNISNEPQTINIGDRIAQGIFIPYFITDDDETVNERVGGFGSTN
jgi:dUTP pyrophosphatase